MFKESGASFGVDNEKPSARQMYARLAHLFHPDTGGDVEMTKILNAAKEKAYNGNTAELEALYNDWCVGNKAESLKKLEGIREELVGLSAELFKVARSKRPAVPEYLTIQKEYKKKCLLSRIEYDSCWIADFLFEEGWIDEAIKDKIVQEL